MLADYIEATQKPDDFTLKGVLDTMNAVAMPVAIVGAAYLAYLGAVNFSTGVDELKERAAATPAGRTATNIFRYNPTWRGLNWFFGGENRPLVTEDEKQEAQDKISQITQPIENVEDTLRENLTDTWEDIKRRASGGGGGGGGGGF